MRDLSIEITRLVGEIHPTAFTGDAGEIGFATARVADALGGMFALIRKHAPNEATAQQAMKMMVERALRFAGEAQTAADGLRGQVIAPPDRRQ